MSVDFDIDELFKAGVISNEHELERAQMAYRTLKILTDKEPYFAEKRKTLFDLIYAYEQIHWADSDKITDEQIEENEKAEKRAEAEWAFFMTRRKIIRKKLSALILTEENLMYILGIENKFQMLEQLNGLRPFDLSDLVAISHLLCIDMNDLVSDFLPHEKAVEMQKNIADLNMGGLLHQFTAAVLLY